MRMKAYIRSAAAISPQDSFEGEGWLKGDAQGVNEWGWFSCLHPEYKTFIKPAQLRRMSPLIRMGIATALRALEKAGVEQPGAIVTGTGLGCVRDTARFLKQMIDNREELLNPTAFIQSTHNTVSGQIALMLGCKAYNLTFSQASLSFETALLDAFLCLEEGMGPVLLGGMDEVVEESFELFRKAGCPGIPGEGATFFVLDRVAGEGAMACIDGLEMIALPEDAARWKKHLEAFLGEQGISAGEVDLLVSGCRCDDPGLEKGLREVFPAAIHLGYKHLVGEYHTVSAFGCWLAAGVLSDRSIPDQCRMNAVEGKTINRALVLNQGMKRELAMLLLSRPDLP